MKEHLTKKTSKSLLLFGLLGIYFGYSHDTSNVIPSALKFGFGITSLILGIVGYYLSRKEEK